MSYSFTVDDLSVNCFWEKGEAETLKFWKSPIHFHFLHEVHLILDGESDFMLGSKTIHLESGDMCVIPPNLMHYPMQMSKNIERVAFFMSLKKISDKGKTYDYCNKVLSNPKGAVFKASEKAKEYFSNFLKQADSSSFTTRNKAINYLQLFFWEICEGLNQPVSLEKTSNAKEEEYASLRIKIDNFVSNQYMKDVTVEDLAKEIGYSKSQTARIVEKITGKTFNRFLLCWRMEIARILIINTEQNLLDIAEAVGYQTYSGFFKAFKSVFGVYPQQMRQIE